MTPCDSPPKISGASAAWTPGVAFSSPVAPQPVIDLAVIFGGAALIGLLVWYFFAPRKAASAELRGGLQQVEVDVRGSYSPDLVRVSAGVPVRLRFNRQDNSDCTSRVVFPDLRKSVSLASPSAPEPT